jgi:hypothetical protein
MTADCEPAGGCTGKTAHADRASAEAQIRGMRRRGMARPRYIGAGQLEAYLCQDCGSWHVGNNKIFKRPRKGA